MVAFVVTDKWCNRCDHEAKYCYKINGFHVIDGFFGTGGESPYIHALCKVCGAPGKFRRRKRNDV